jgi:CrcB protein
MLRDVLFVAAGGAIGSALRYSAMVWISQRLSQGFPWHTFLVNVTGSFVLGLLLSVSVEHGGWDRWTLFLGIGVLGGFTTFSTFSFESLRLIEDGLVGVGAANMLLSVVVGVAAAAAGIALGRTI